MVNRVERKTESGEVVSEAVLAPGGIYGQSCTIFPAQNLVFAKFSTYDFSSMSELFELDDRDFRSFEAIADTLTK